MPACRWQLGGSKLQRHSNVLIMKYTDVSVSSSRTRGTRERGKRAGAFSPAVAEPAPPPAGCRFLPPPTIPSLCLHRTSPFRRPLTLIIGKIQANKPQSYLREKFLYILLLGNCDQWQSHHVSDFWVPAGIMLRKM